MKNKWLRLIVPALLTAGIQHPALAQQPTQGTIQSRFPPPPGYRRVTAVPGSFGTYLTALPLQPAGASVHLYNGALKGNQAAHAAVIRMDVGHTDLQQCADAVMRLRAEYLYAAGRYDEIVFHLTNGFAAAFSQWRKGNRLSVHGAAVRWVQAAAPSSAYPVFRDYLTAVFTYAGTLSLSRELTAVPLADMQAGDVLIRGGSPGHAVIVVDMAVNSRGQKVFMLAQSYMPAQEIQVLRNPERPDLSPWYLLDASPQVLTPEWTFSSSELKRFP